MIECHACKAAELASRTYGHYKSGCQSCEARALAASPQAHEALLGYPQALQAAMHLLWPTQEQYRLGRLEVYRWIKLVDSAKAEA